MLYRLNMNGADPMLCEAEELPAVFLAKRQGNMAILKSGACNTDYLVSITKADVKEKLKPIFETDPTKRPAPVERPKEEQSRYEMKPSKPIVHDPWKK